MNKKGLSAIVSFLMVILLVFVAIGIFCFITKNLFGPEFKIYRKDCAYESFEKEVCVTIEVEKIEINLFYIFEKNLDTYTIFVSNKSFNYEKCPDEVFYVNEEFVKYDLHNYYLFKNIQNKCEYNFTQIILKQNLTIEWIDKNCELIKDYGYEAVITEGSDFLWNKKYKCGSYIVEVLG